MDGLKLHLVGWEDGQKVEQDLQVTDRWTIHAADEIHVTFPTSANADEVTIKLKQQPHALNASRLGVGACVWEGELLLAAYLAQQPRHRFIGCHAIELGSGPGLAGLLIAAMGGNAIISDKEVVLGLVQDNISLNGVSKDQRRGATSGWAEALALEWGAPGYLELAHSLAAQPLDWILAADCVYIDNEGQSPSTPDFIQVCSILARATSAPRCLVSFELRSDHVKTVFLREAHKAFSKVTRVPTASLPKGCRVDHIELWELGL